MLNYQFPADLLYAVRKLLVVSSFLLDCTLFEKLGWQVFDDVLLSPTFMKCPLNITDVRDNGRPNQLLSSQTVLLCNELTLLYLQQINLGIAELLV